MWISLLKAVGIIAAVSVVLGLVLAVANKFLKVENDERIDKVTEMLPNANCGGCGYAGCAAFAEAIVKGECSNLSQCRPSKVEAKQKIQQYLKETPNKDGSTVDVTY